MALQLVLWAILNPTVFIEKEEDASAINSVVVLEELTKIIFRIFMCLNVYLADGYVFLLIWASIQSQIAKDKTKYLNT